MNSILAQKYQLRRRLKQARNEIPESSRKESNLAIQRKLLSQPDIQGAEYIFCFISYGSEVHTHEVIDELMSQGKKLAVPRIMDSGQMNAIAFKNWDELEQGQLGIPSPLDVSPLSDTFDVVITPGLGFSEDGKRIGFGRGYYDKWFKSNVAGTKIALAYDTQIVDDIPTDENDMSVDMIITEKRVIEVSRHYSDS